MCLDILNSYRTSPANQTKPGLVNGIVCSCPDDCDSVIYTKVQYERKTAQQVTARKIHKYILFVGLIILIPNQSLANNAPIIQPGAPGENSKILDPSLASNIAGASYVEADVKFLEGMITHHKQAIVMSKLAKKRTNNKTILDLAKRIDVSQEDEINFMESWLKSRKEIKTNTSHNHHMHMEMAGMASPEQLIELENSKIDYDFSVVSDWFAASVKGHIGKGFLFKEVFPW